VRAVVGLVFLAAVVFHLSMDQPQRLVRLKQIFRCGGKLERQPAPPGPGLAVAKVPDRSGTFGSAPVLASGNRGCPVIKRAPRVREADEQKKAVAESGSDDPVSVRHLVVAARTGTGPRGSPIAIPRPAW
jgi:hypothetical protein